MPSDIASEKHLLRTEMARRRQDAFQSGERERHVTAASGHLSSLLVGRFGDALRDQVLAGYMAMRTEIDPRNVMAAHSGPVCVPVIPGRDMALEFHRWTPTTAMVEGNFKALIPQQRDPLVPTVLIVPLLAFDRRGYRLGYGGGFYDRTLADLRAKDEIFAVGFAFAAQEMGEVPINDTDEALDYVVTPDEVIFGSR